MLFVLFNGVETNFKFENDSSFETYMKFENKTVNKEDFNELNAKIDAFILVESRFDFDVTTNFTFEIIC